MEDQVISRQQRRYLERERAKAERHKLRKVQRRSRPLDPFTRFYNLARGVLMTSDKAQPPSMRAVRKTARFLSTHVEQYRIPRHLWGSWRSWPKQRGVLDVKTL